MNEYTAQAKNFLKTAHCRMSMTLKDEQKPFPNTTETELHNVYRVVLRKGHRSYSFDFYDSLDNTRKGNHPTEYDVLACLEPYIDDSFEKFCANYGYDTDSRRAERIWKACRKQSEKLSKLFTESELDLLCEIV